MRQPTIRRRARRTLATVTVTIFTAVAGCTQTQTQTHTDAIGNATVGGSTFGGDQAPPPAAATHFAAGQLAESRGEYEKAIAQYRAALQLDPALPAPLFRLGMLLTAQRQYAPATAAWQQYVAATHGSAAAYSNLAICLDLAGKPTEAEQAFRAGVAKDPKYEPCRTNYGLMLARQGRLDAAAEQLRAVLSPAEVQYDLASVLEQQGKPTAARARYREALRLDPAFGDAQARLAAMD